MKVQQLYILLVIIWTSSSSCGQKEPIAYFSSDNSSFVIFDLYAQLNDSIYTLIDSNAQECMSMESVADFNNDGLPDVLVGHIPGCGGNCCLNAYAFFSYNKGTFVKTKLVGNGEYLETEDWNGLPTVLIHSIVFDSTIGHQRWVKERYGLQGDSIVKIESYTSAKINASEGDYLLQWDSSYYQPDDYFEMTITKEGQSLWALAHRYQTSVAAIIALNHKKNDSLQLGEQLKIPKQNHQLFIFHQVQGNGETLWRISQQYKVPVDIIKKINGLQNDMIKVGETLKIPK